MTTEEAQAFARWYEVDRKGQPAGPDLIRWLEAIEVLERAGSRRMTAGQRGFLQTVRSRRSALPQGAE